MSSGRAASSASSRGAGRRLPSGRQIDRSLGRLETGAPIGRRHATLFLDPMPLTICYVTHETPAAGAWNMAVDEARLAVAAKPDGDEDSVWLRFYSWARPTLSLGYFQRLADRRLHDASAACPVVRRLSGGGAILHDRELTYSLVVRTDSALAKKPPRLYRLMHTALVEALREFGVAGRFGLPRGERVRPAGSSFLCFRRLSENDVLVPENGTGEWAKVAGSAQRRRRGAILQHGSVVLAQSDAAPEIPGIQEISQKAISQIALAEEWCASVKSLYGWDLRYTTSEATLDPAAVETARAKYDSDAWTTRY